MGTTLCFGCMESLANVEQICSNCGYEVGTTAKEAYHMNPGTMLHGRYRVGRVLGYGGFGVTYIGYDTVLEQKVAIKEYLPSDFSTRMPGQMRLSIYSGESAEQFALGLKSFVDESQRLSKFNGVPGVVQIRDSFIDNNTAYIIMEYLEGKTVKERLLESGPYDYEQAEDIIVSVLCTLEVVHPTGIIHRDISPDNIFITDDGEVKLLDFGAARYAATEHSKSLSVILKPGFAPEEQYRTRGNQGPWSDVYATGATMYKMLTGITPEESLERLAKDDLASPRKLGIKISENAEIALLNAMNVKPEERTQSAEAFRQELQSASPVARLEEKKRKNDTGRWPVWLKIAIVSAAAAVVLVPVLIFSGLLGAITGSGKFVLEGYVNAPGVVNYYENEARETVAASELVFSISGKESNEYSPEGVIMRQSPLPGRLLRYGEVVNVTVSAGPVQIYTPDVIHWLLDDVISTLQEEGFRVELDEIDDLQYADGTILSQDLEPGSEHNQGTVLKISVARGGLKIAGEDVDVPDVTAEKLSLEDAMRIMREAGLFAVIGEIIFNDEVPEGVALIQSLNPGEKVARGSVVRLSISSNNNEIRVPDTQYKSEGEAISMLEMRGFVVKCDYEKSDIVQKGLVIKQNLESGVRVKGGSEINLLISLGNDVDVPTVTGRGKDDAVAALEGAGFRVTVREEFSETVESGKIVYQTPQGGEMAAKGSSVAIAVSKGKDPSNRPVSIPGVSGQNRSEAEAALIKAGFTPQVSTAHSDTVAKDAVISQSPSGGEALKGTVVSIVVSLGSDKRTAPAVAGMDEGGAVSAIQGAGLGVNVVREHSDGTARGYVIRQDMSGQVSMNSTVTITVSRGTANSGWIDGDGSNIDRSQYDVQVKTLYRYQDKETQAFNSQQGGEWSLVSDNSAWGNWSGWSRTIYTESGSQQVESQYVPATIETYYKYYHWTDGNGRTLNYNGTGYNYRHEYESSSLLSANNLWGGGVYSYSGIACSSCGLSERWYPGVSDFDTNPGPFTRETVAAHNLYRYRDMIYSYTYSRWLSWTDWTENQVSASANRNVETRQQYLYVGK